jgi:hypothetical protein
MEAVAHWGKHHEYKQVPISLHSNKPLDQVVVGSVALTTTPFWGVW